MKTVAILGGGWLGEALASQLASFYNIKISTTTSSKKASFEQQGFQSYIINEENLHSLSELLFCDFLIIAVPPSKFKNLNAFLQTILEKNCAQQTIYISSTSVYDDIEILLNEDFEIKTPMNAILYKSEKLFDLNKTTILRCSGLMGYNRIAGKYFSNKVVKDKNTLVNYVHRDDVIGAIHFAMEKKLVGIFNLCSKEHLTKEEIYTYNAKRYGFELPVFEDKVSKKRIIDGSKISRLGFRYNYETLKTYK